MGSRINLKVRIRTMNVNYVKMLDYFHREVRVRVKSFDSFRYGIRMMFGFVGKECSPIFAQRVSRSYRALQLHSKLWSNHVSTLSKQHNTNPKRWLLGLVMYSLCNPKFVTIPDDELVSHMDDLEYIHELTAATVVCPSCQDRLVINKKLPNIKYCHCASSEQAYNKKIQGFPWVPLLETSDLLIWRKPHPEYDGLYTYKVYGYYDDISPEDFLTTQLDLEYRIKWDNLTLQLKVVDMDKSSSSEVIYWEMKWPKMFSNRDYCFVRRHLINKDENTVIIMSKAVVHPDCPEIKGTVRVREYWSIMQIKAVKGMSDRGVEFGLTYFDNPGLSLPTWLVNWAAMAGIPDFLNKVRLAARLKRDCIEKNLQLKTSNFAELNKSVPVQESMKKCITNPEIRSEIQTNLPAGESPKKSKSQSPVNTDGDKNNNVSNTESNNSVNINEASYRKEVNTNTNEAQANTSSVSVLPTSTVHVATTNEKSVNVSTASSENGEILSQFFKENFLNPPNPLNEG